MSKIRQYTEQQIEQLIKEQISKEIMYDSDFVLESNESLFARGIINSMAVIRLIRFMEEKFDISIEVEEETRQNFESVNSLKNFVLKKYQS
ncbi:MAG TPA: acyl carrier protein [Cyanobacteria bacterium UBA8803]|nr:acyl carrier protein [Cyanobacteria bacterium UBA9273]HBL59138.1 acyl carrier protein [Cyanobacteria bacterium UBA8803]